MSKKFKQTVAMTANSDGTFNGKGVFNSCAAKLPAGEGEIRLCH